jgi:hypothetical protein
VQVYSVAAGSDNMKKWRTVALLSLVDWFVPLNALLEWWGVIYAETATRLRTLLASTGHGTGCARHHLPR